MFRYADDVTLQAILKKELLLVCQKLIVGAKWARLSVNVEKNKINEDRTKSYLCK